MTAQELEQQRRLKWRLAGNPIRTLDEARQFIEEVGFCLVYPFHGGRVQLPTFIGAWLGTDDRLPSARRAQSDQRARGATELMVQLLRSQAAFEANTFGESGFLISAENFPYLYALIGDRNPRQVELKRSAGKFSPLAEDAFLAIVQHGPRSKGGLRDILGGDLSIAALDRALDELWSVLRITRVDHRPREGAFWDALFRWAPDAVKKGLDLSMGEALSALLTQYLDCMIAADQTEIDAFFRPMASASRVRDAVNALLVAREIRMVNVDHRSLLELAAAPKPAVAKPEVAPPIRAVLVRGGSGAEKRRRGR